MKKIIRMAIFSFLVISIIVIISCHKNRQEQEIKKTRVVLVDVEKRELARPLHTYGYLASKKEIKLSFKTGGIIKKITVEEGQLVRTGQTLAILALEEINSLVNQTKSGYEKAKRDLERVANLYRDRAATLGQYQDAQTAFQVAESQLKAADFNRRYSEIRAPCQGRILKRLMEENELIAPGMPVFLFGAADNGKDWVVRVGVSDRDFIRLQVGNPADVFFDAYPREKFAAQVTKIAEAPDPLSGTYEIEMTLNIEKRKVTSGLVVRTVIFPVDKQSYFIIPIHCLVKADGENGYVFTVDRQNRVARQVPVVIGFIFDDKITLLSGLENVTQVVSEGAPYLVDGAKIEIVAANAFSQQVR